MTRGIIKERGQKSKAWRKVIQEQTMEISRSAMKKKNDHKIKCNYLVEFAKFSFNILYNYKIINRYTQ